MSNSYIQQARHMQQLPFLARRLLRLVAQHGPVAIAELYELSQIEDAFSTTATTLILNGLITKCVATSSYTITPAGAQVVATEQGVNSVRLHSSHLEAA